MTMTEYKLMDSKDGIIYEAETVYPNATTDTNEYPGNRRQVLEGTPPPGTVLVKTAGNALMAVDRSVLGQKNVVCVVVPFGKGPGDEILVKCPYTERLLSVRVPEDIGQGQVMFVQSPVECEVKAKQLDDNNDYDDLKLAAEHELEERHFGEEHESSKRGDKDKTDDGFEMV